MAQALAQRSGSSLRLAGGVLRGRRLAVASGVRPTGSRLREALFSIWQARIEGCRFLDLFAGSGAVGLEAISRGARQAVFVEGSARVFEVLRRNVRELAADQARLERARLPAGLERLFFRLPPSGGTKEGFDVIFADPPYAFTDLDALLLRAAPWLRSGGEMAIEHSCRLEIDQPQSPWQLRERRSYGDSCVSFFRQGGAGVEARSG